MPFQSTGTKVTATYTQFEFQNISFWEVVKYIPPPRYISGRLFLNQINASFFVNLMNTLHIGLIVWCKLGKPKIQHLYIISLHQIHIITTYNHRVLI